MLGHGLAYLVCLMLGHDKFPIFERTVTGAQWRCTRCHRVQVSETLRRAS